MLRRRNLEMTRFRPNTKVLVLVFLLYTATFIEECLFAQKALAQDQDSQIITSKTMYLTLLKHKEPETRMRALKELARLRDSSTLPAIKKLLKDKIDIVRYHAALALAKMNDSSGYEVLVEAMKDGPAEVKEGAIWFVWDRLDKEAAQAVIQSLKDRKTNMWAKGAIVRGLVIAQGKSCVPILLDLLDEEKMGLQIEIVRALGILRDPSTISRIVPFLDYPHQRMRSAAAMSLGLIGRKSAIRALLRQLEKEDRLIGYMDLYWALGRTGDASVVPVLISGFDKGGDRSGVHSPSAEVVLQALGYINDEASISFVTRKIRSEDSYIRRAAIESAAKLKVASVIPLLIEETRKPVSSGYGNRFVIYALGEMGGPEAESFLVKLFSDPWIADVNFMGYTKHKFPVKFEAACALAKMGRAEVKDFFLTVAENPECFEWYYRYKAASALGMLGEEAMIPLLLDNLNLEIPFSNESHCEMSLKNARKLVILDTLSALRFLKLRDKEVVRTLNRLLVQECFRSREYHTIDHEAILNTLNDLTAGESKTTVGIMRREQKSLKEESENKISKSVIASELVNQGILKDISVLAKNAEKAFDVDFPASMSAWISLNLKDVEIRKALKLLAEKGKLKLAISKTVEGRCPMFVINMTVEDAFKGLLRYKKLACIKEKNTYYVMTKKEYLSKYKDKMEVLRRMKGFRLKHAKPQKAFAVLETFVSDLGKVTVDEKSRSVLLNDTPERIMEMAKVIACLDHPKIEHAEGFGKPKESRVEPEDEIAKYLNLLKHDDSEQKIFALKKLRKMDDRSRSMEAVRKLLIDKDPQIRYHAALVMLGPPSANPDDLRQVKVVRLKWAKPAKVFQSLYPMQSMAGSYGSVIVDEEMRVVIIWDVPEKITEMAKMVAEMESAAETSSVLHNDTTTVPPPPETLDFTQLIKGPLLNIIVALALSMIFLVAMMRSLKKKRTKKQPEQTPKDKWPGSL